MPKGKKIAFSRYEVGVVGMFLTTLIPTFLVLCFLMYWLQVRQEAATEGMTNIRIYFGALAVFFVLLTLAAFLVRRLSRDIALAAGWYAVYLIVFLGNLLLLAKCYTDSNAVYPHMSNDWLVWHGRSDKKVFLLMCGICVAAILVFLWAKHKRRLVEFCRYPVYFAASGLAGGALYCANWIAEDKLHGNAYYTSVYNALQNAPYDYSNQSIYGHYAILLKYPVKLLGGDFKAFAIAISLVGALSVFFVALTLDLCVKNHFISMLGAFSLPFMFWYYPKNHWQMFPHRVFFASIMLYLIAGYFCRTTGDMYRRPFVYQVRKGRKATGYVVAALSLLWNVETGIGCLGTWALACVLHDVAEKPETFRWTMLCKSVLQNAVYSIFTVLGTIVFFNGYNMLLGESWHRFAFFMFPFLHNWDAPEGLTVYAKESVVAAGTVGGGVGQTAQNLDMGFTDALSIPLSKQISPWYFVLMLMGLAVIAALARILYHRQKATDYVLGLAGILAFTQLPYFINRACFDYLAIVLFEAVVILGILADEKAEEKMLWLKGPYQCLFVGILAVMSVFSLWQADFRYTDRKDSGYYDMTEFTELLEGIRDKVPENTVGFGLGIQEIYAQLGWDTCCYVADDNLITSTDTMMTFARDSYEAGECLVIYRSKRTDDAVPVQTYMGYWGYEPEAVEVYEYWNLDFDENYDWNMYYVGLDKNMGNFLLERE